MWRTGRWFRPLLVRPAHDLACAIRVTLGLNFAPQLLAVVTALLPPLLQICQIGVEGARHCCGGSTFRKLLSVDKLTDSRAAEAKQASNMSLRKALRQERVHRVVAVVAPSPAFLLTRPLTRGREA